LFLQKSRTQFIYTSTTMLREARSEELRERNQQVKVKGPSFGRKVAFLWQ
jgi:hypothetical protein